MRPTIIVNPEPTVKPIRYEELCKMDAFVMLRSGGCVWALPNMLDIKVTSRLPYMLKPVDDLVMETFIEIITQTERKLCNRKYGTELKFYISI